MSSVSGYVGECVGKYVGGCVCMEYLLVLTVGMLGVWRTSLQWARMGDWMKWACWMIDEV